MTKRTKWLVVGTIAILAVGAGLFALTRRPAGDAKIGAIVAPKNTSTATNERAASAPAKTAGIPKSQTAANTPPPAITERGGRGRIYGTAKSPGGGDISVELHRVPSWRDSDFDYEESKVATVAVGADGAFEFPGVAMGGYMLFASAPGYTMHSGVVLSAERPEENVTMVLVPGGTISGRVVNAKNEPVAGARVFVGGWNIEGQKTSAPREIALATQCRTDAAGAFTLDHLRKSMHNEPGFQIAVKAAGYATLLSEYFQAGTEGVTLTLKPGNIVSGRLTALDTGAPLPDKLVAIDTKVSIEKLTGKTDAEGIFFVSDVPSGTLTATLRDDELVLTADSAKIQVADGAPTEDIELKAGAGGRLSGRIYNSDSGQGLSGVKVYTSLTSDEGQGLKEAKTNASGTFLFKGLKPGAYRMAHEKPDGYPERYDDPNRERLVTVEAGKETSGVDFVLTRGLVITGRVVDEAGEPVAQAWVNGSVSKGGGQDSTQTRNDGTFVVAGFSAGQEVKLFATKEGYAQFSSEPATGRVIVNEDGASGVKLVLGEAASISGTVVSKSGRPMPGVRTWVSGAGAGGSSSNTGADGAVTYSGLAPGVYTFGFDGVPMRNDDKNVQKVTVRKGEKLAGVRIIYPELGGLRISGRVKDVRGIGIASAEVRLQGKVIRQATADSEGKFTIDGLSAGKVTLTASGYSYSSGTPVTVDAGDMNVELVLKPLAKIEGQVLSAATAQPVTSFSVRTRGEARNPGHIREGYQAMSDPQGRFSLDRVEDGALALDVRAEGFADTSVPLTGIAGGETRRDVLVRMPVGIEVAGRVVDSAGNGIGGARIFLGGVPQEYQQTDLLRATSAGDGAFKLTSLPAGSVQIAASHPKYAPKTVTASLTPNTENRVEIVLTAGGSVEGVVTLDGKGLQGANIGVGSRGGGAGRNAQTDGQGRYSIAGVQEGPLILNASIPGAPGARGRQKSAPIEVKDGFVTEMNIDFVSGGSAIEGTVYTGPNQPITDQVYVGVGLRGVDGNMEAFNVQTDGSGKFVLEGLPPGSALLQVSTPANGQKSVSVNVGKNQRVHQDILLYGGGTIRINVTGLDPSRACAALVLTGNTDVPRLTMQSILSFQNRMAGVAQIQNGQGTVSGIDAGEYTLLVVSYNAAAEQNGGDPFAGAIWATKVIEMEKDKELSVSIALKN